MSKNLQENTGRNLQTGGGNSQSGNENRKEPYLSGTGPLDDYTELVQAAERR